jgi:prepilin-type N-terminal cleavage/methylation domain-containing protein/prepilin-type processing-associated H-X9-DG protein
MNRKAFTLIELLVVIAIIAILAAILFPVFAQAKNAAKKSVETSHMKQIALAGLMYSADYNDVFPLAYRHDNAPGEGGFPYVLSVFPYVKNVDIYVTPAGKPNGVSNPDWDYIWSYGVVPPSGVKQQPYYEVGDTPLGQRLGIVGARYQSVLGWAQQSGPVGAWGPYFQFYDASESITIPSKSQSNLDDVAGTALIFSAGEPFSDHLTNNGLGQELGYCCSSRTSYNPGAPTIAGATPRWGGPDSAAGMTCGPWSNMTAISEDGVDELASNGQSVIAFADGHVETMALSQLYAPEDIDGQLYLTTFGARN